MALSSSTASIDDMKKATPFTTPTTTPEISDDDRSFDLDAQRLAEMGYTQDMKRTFTVWSVLGVGFSLTNSWFGISAALVTGINSGGPVLIVYGIILIALVSTCVAITLSELASSMPNAGGQYFWANELAPKKWAGAASWTTGWFAWWGSIFTSASVALGLGSACMGCIQLFHPDLEIKPWMTFIAYQILTWFCFLFNCYGKLLPKIATFTLYCSLISFFIIIVVVPARAPTFQDAIFVFANFVNNTGWKSNPIAFIVGLINMNWAFACLDSATHLAEEVHRPEKMVPIAIMGTVAIGFTTAWTFSVVMFFSMNDLDRLFAAYVPILELFYQAVGNKAGAVCLEILVICTGLGCQIACHTWQSRLCWSFARDRGLPASQWLSKVNTRIDVPLNAHFASCVIVSILGCLYLGSYTAFNSMVTACIVLLYISYSIPVIFLLIKGRDNIQHGPFWLGKVGLFANCVLLAWTLFTLIMYSFPPVMPVKFSNVNYVSAVYAVVVAVGLGYWFGRGKRTFRNQEERRTDARRVSEAGLIARRASSAAGQVVR